jgi:hypothetical protein
MKLHMFCKYVGLAAGTAGGLLILLGIIGFFAGEILGVRNYMTFFWFSQPVFLLAIFGMVTHIGCRDHCDCEEKK